MSNKGSTSNFDFGITNNTIQNVLGSLRTVDPTVTHEYMNDFDDFFTDEWTITKSLDNAQATVSLAEEDGGILVLTNEGGESSDNNFIGLQKFIRSFQFEIGIRLYFKARFKISDAIQSDLIIGLQITDTTPFSVSDGVYFQKVDGNTTLDFHVVKNSTASTKTAIATLTTDTYITVGFVYDGDSDIKYYAGVNSREPDYVGKVAITNLPDDEVLGISIALQNGEAIAKSMSIDYIYIAKER